MNELHDRQGTHEYFWFALCLLLLLAASTVRSPEAETASTNNAAARP